MLLDVLYRHETYVAPAHGFADRLGNGRVVLVRLHGRLDELQCNQLNGGAELLELARPVMRTAAGLHADQTRLTLDLLEIMNGENAPLFPIS